jgi:hypothetical protein
VQSPAPWLWRPPPPRCQTLCPHTRTGHKQRWPQCGSCLLLRGTDWQEQRCSHPQHRQTQAPTRTVRLHGLKIATNALQVLCPGIRALGRGCGIKSFKCQHKFCAGLRIRLCLLGKQRGERTGGHCPLVALLVAKPIQYSFRRLYFFFSCVCLPPSDTTSRVAVGLFFGIGLAHRTEDVVCVCIHERGSFMLTLA